MTIDRSAKRGERHSRELLEMPQRLAEFAAATDERFRSIDERFVAVDRRFERLERDLGPIKGEHARRAALREADLIAEESGLTYIRTLTDQDVRELLRSSDTSGISAGDLRSFRRADMLVEARDAAGEPCYLAAEISFTVNGRDTRRAVRNAGLLERFTGRRAYAAVAGLRRDDRIGGVIETGEVTWYQMDVRTLESE